MTTWVAICKSIDRVEHIQIHPNRLSKPSAICAASSDLSFLWLTRSVKPHCYHLMYLFIYLFIYLFVYESRAPVTWSSVQSELVVLVLSLGWSNFFSGDCITSQLSLYKPTDSLQKLSCFAEWPLGQGAKKDSSVRRLANRHRLGLYYKCRLCESFYTLTQV